MKQSVQVVAFVLGSLVAAAAGVAQQGGCGTGCNGGGGCGQGGGPWRTEARRVVVEKPAVEERTAALQVALAGEYRARDLYESAYERFGLRRYERLAAAERRHIDALTALIVARGATPAEPSAVEEAAATVEGTDTLAIEVEKAAIAQFAKLLDGLAAGPERATLEALQAANFRHRDAANQGEEKAGRGRFDGNGRRRRGGNDGGATVQSGAACVLGSSRRC
ncbi:MAG: hypothetical protein RL398_1414 [Planctomycetota bacterium]